MGVAPQRMQSWVDSANDPEGDFPLENLPLGIFDDGLGGRIGMAIGDKLLDLAGCAAEGLLEALPAAVVAACRIDRELNALAAEGNAGPRALRERVRQLLSSSEHRAGVEPWLLEQKSVGMCPPFRIGDYTDFYASIHHATNVGRLFRPDTPLLPNYKWIPIGYHGRASSIVVSGAAVRRPSGQTKAPDAATPVFGPSRMLDYELEVGFFIGQGNALGTPIPLDRAEQSVFGLCLMNDESARDIQAWEYQPLGPFLGKSFATAISPWVVSLDALAPFRVPAVERPDGDPQPLPYLLNEQDRAQGGFDVNLEVWLATARMRAAGQAPARISQANLRDLYWTLGQMVTHHASNGCNLRPGDLLATGTVSGATPDSVGSLHERTKRGAEPLVLPNGEQRRFLEDGDEVILKGWCERDGFARIGFGECRSTVAPALVNQ
ncbi:MAG: fumarylacetoacetase [Acidobacteriaceae bacterium]